MDNLFWNQLNFQMSDILSSLDPQQRQAVLQTEGPVLIVAGAGSGKTRVLTTRIAYILSKGADPSSVLALTFTKKAASEMKERIAAMVGERSARKLVMGTFHSVFVRFLRDYAEWLGYPKTFTIMDTSDSTTAIKRVIKEMGLPDSYKPKKVLSRISEAKNNLILPAAYGGNPERIKNDTSQKIPRMYEVYPRYQNLLKSQGVMDFDDILVNMALLLKANENARSEISSRFSHILVDEYQDTNFAQYQIIRMLTTGHNNICVVGDDSQSIYAFRGARVENILNFRRDYPTTKVFRLEHNYRSTKNIVGAANSLIEKNSARIPKECFSTGEDGEKIRLIASYSEAEEAVLVASSIISRMQKEHLEYSDFAILYRTNSQSRALEEALRKRNLPYMIYSGTSFFDRMEVKDMMAYLRLAVNTSDNESFRRAINKPARGIGDVTLSALEQAAGAWGCSMYEASLREGLEEFGLKGAATRKLREFSSMISTAVKAIPLKNADWVTKFLVDSSGMYTMYHLDTSLESQTRASNVQELVNSVAAWVGEMRHDFVEDLMAQGEVMDESEVDEGRYPVFTLGDYLENISLLSSVDVSEEDSANKISLMTVHSSKGLEFPYVYVTGMEDNLFPSGGFDASPNDIEEERRLFYVAITRAKKAVDLSYASSRMRNGSIQDSTPSRFLYEIDPLFLVNPLRRQERSYGGFFSGGGGSISFERPSQSKPSFQKQDRFSFPRQNTPSRPSQKATPARPSQSTPRSMPPKVSGSPATHVPSVPLENFSELSVYSLREGMRVEHSKFGFGTIGKIDVKEGKVEVSFDDGNLRKILLRYAKFRIVEG